MLLKINFSDFWPGFIKTDNYFYNLLSREFELIIADDPDILFYSCYGEEYLRYDCLRIFYSAENMRPDLSGCDFALTFDYLEDPRHFRLPLYALYIEQKNKLNELLATRSRDEAAKLWDQKTKFCCMVVSNPKGKKRLDFFHKLSKYKQVDSGGKWMNNVGGPVPNKLEFIRDYKFVISFENSSFPGYTTEKILEPLFEECIPLYWGNPLIAKDFNNHRFINHGDYSGDEEMIEAIIRLDREPDRAIDMLLEPKFTGNKIPEYIDTGNVMAFLRAIIERRGQITPVAKIPGQRLRHVINRKNAIAGHYLGKLLGRNFR